MSTFDWNFGAHGPLGTLAPATTAPDLAAQTASSPNALVTYSQPAIGGIYPTGQYDNNDPGWSGGPQYSDMLNAQLAEDINNAAVARDAMSMMPATTPGRAVSGAIKAAGALGVPTTPFNLGVMGIEFFANPQRMEEFYGRSPANLLDVYAQLREDGRKLADGFAREKLPGAGSWDHNGNASGFVDPYSGRVVDDFSGAYGDYSGNSGGGYDSGYGTGLDGGYGGYGDFA